MKGNGHLSALHFERAPRRIVSLVPSMTESLFDLGAGDRVVGVTDYCVHPAEAVALLPRVGGTKNPNVALIAGLKPDLVIANQEENTKAAVEALEARGLRVWVTFPRTVREAVDLLHVLIKLCDAPHAATRVDILERTLEWAVAASTSQTRPRVFVPIWRDTADPPAWWMTANKETYLHDLLTVCGGANVFAERIRAGQPRGAERAPAFDPTAPTPPVTGEARYPRVTSDDVIAAEPDIILLPSEPFEFTEADRELAATLFAETLAARANRVHLCDGSLLTWHGTRLARALAEIPSLLQA